MALIDVLIPTYRRKTGLAVVLTSLLGQTFRDFNVIISDQTEEESYLDSIVSLCIVIYRVGALPNSDSSCSSRVAHPMCITSTMMCC